MAYLQLEQLTDASASGAVRIPHRQLGTLERDVIRLAFADGRSSLHAPGPLARLGTLLTGFERRHGLADPGLEALRRYAILYRLDGERLDPVEAQAVADAGFDELDVRDVQLLVDRQIAHRASATKWRTAAFVTPLLWAAALVGTTFAIRQIVEDIAVSAVVTGLLAVTAASFHHPARS